MTITLGRYIFLFLFYSYIIFNIKLLQKLALVQQQDGDKEVNFGAMTGCLIYEVLSAPQAPTLEK